MECRCFMFDLVILNVSVQNFDYGNNTLTVEANFNGTEFTIEPHPGKVDEFKQGRTCEFKAFPDELRNDLLNRPLKLKIRANNEEVKGEVVIPWPEELLNKLETEHFIQFSHFDQCDILVNRVVTGKVGIQYRLRAKCELSQSEGSGEGEGNHCDIQNELKKLVNPNEVFFLLQNDSDDCSAFQTGGDKLEMSYPTALDLSKFRNFHGKVVRDPGVFDQVYSLDCCHTKKYTARDCNQNSVCMQSIGVPSKYEREPPKCQASKSSLQWACKAKQHVRECPHSSKFSDETESCSCVETKNNIFDNGKIKNICHYPEPPPDLVETVNIRSKLCPVCNSDVSWLPKLAACPKCGHKPVPYAVERSYNEHLTADEILEEWAVDVPRKSTTNNQITKNENRCVCKNGKICAYCRIRKLCREAVRTTKCDDKNGNSSGGNELPPDKLCESTGESDSRTYLAKVFSELRDLYNLKPNKAKRTFEYNKKYEKAFAQPKRSESLGNMRTSSRSIQKKKTSLTKNFTPEVKSKWCKGKFYNYKAIRKYPGTLIGHQECISSGKSVPRNMGWLWNTDNIGTRRGWKPGAIRKPIKEIMKYFLKDFPVDSLRVSKYSRNKVLKKESEELIQKPTLQISKKKGVYTIIMRPLKDATLLKMCADPYVPMKPICFKIVKNPLSVHTREMKKQLKKQFHKCTCHKPLSACYCRTYLDKKRLEFEVNKACRQKGIPSLKDTLVLSDTTDSEEEFEFGVTPPAGIIKPHLEKKPDLVSRDTQYSEKDYAIKPVSRMAFNKYMKPYDSSGGRIICAGGAGDGKYDPDTGGRNGKGAGSNLGGGRSSAGRYTSIGSRGGRGVGAGVSGSGIAGGRGGHISVGGNKLAGIVAGRGGSSRAMGRDSKNARAFTGSGFRATNQPPLFCNIARRRKAESSCPPPEVLCIPSC